MANRCSGERRDEQYVESWGNPQKESNGAVGDTRVMALWSVLYLSFNGAAICHHSLTELL